MSLRMRLRMAGMESTRRLEGVLQVVVRCIWLRDHSGLRGSIAMDKN